MKKYLGSYMTAYAAIVLPIFCFLPLIFAFSMLSIEINFPTVVLSLMCASCTLIWGIYGFREKNQLYSWAFFKKDRVEVNCLFSKNNTILYEECNSSGIGYYTHGVLNSKAGTKIFFIFLSYNRFDESFRKNINLWKPSKTQIKVQFNKKLYTYLLSVLPKKQARMLLRDYEKYFA